MKCNTSSFYLKMIRYKEMTTSWKANAFKTFNYVECLNFENCI